MAHVRAAEVGALHHAKAAVVGSLVDVQQENHKVQAAVIQFLLDEIRVLRIDVHKISQETRSKHAHQTGTTGLRIIRE